MENAICLKVYDVDYSFIISNYLDKKLWDKEWLLFQYKNDTVTLSIEHINVKKHSILFNIKYTTKEHNLYYNTSNEYLEYFIKNMNISDIKRLINEKIWKVLVNIDSALYSKSVEYESAYKIYVAAKNSLRDIAKEFLDENLIENENIRDAYIDRYVDDNDSKYYNIFSDSSIVNKYRYNYEILEVFATSISDDFKINKIKEANKLNADYIDFQSKLESIMKELSILKTDDEKLNDDELEFKNNKIEEFKMNLEAI